MYRVFRSEWYGKKLQGLDKAEAARIEKFEQHLKEEPFSGKPLGYRFFREKRFDGKRLLFLIYEKHSVLFLVTIKDKKAQQRDIDFIVSNLNVYKNEIDELAKRL
jgi:mRNA-degrading endonuclease RelE of RelBE toxin-antitoxin system